MDLNRALAMAVIAAIAGIGYTSYSQADASVTATSTDEWEPTAAVPLLKIRQGEKFKLFDGAGGGIRWSPWISNNASQARNIHLSGLLMVSSSTEANAANPAEKEKIDVLSIGIVVGYQWFQVGYGRDVITSESADSFRAKKKDFLMLNLGGKIDF